jgi:uncharacterized protein YprB with RNaseH-like and TPR domain
LSVNSSKQTLRPLAPLVVEPKHIVSIDIERKPMLVKCWGLFDQNMGIKQIVEESRTVSFAAIVDGDRENPVFRSEYHNGRTKMLNDLWLVMDMADEIVTYNGKAFDVKHINTELMLNEFAPPSTYKHTDMLPLVRKHFKLDSNKLDWWAQMTKIGKKLDYGISHFELIDRCEAKDEEAMTLFREYNIQDAILNVDLQERVGLWIQ